MAVWCIGKNRAAARKAARKAVRGLCECKAGQLPENAGNIVNLGKKGFLWKAVWI